MPSPSPTDLELVRGLHARDPKILTRVYGDYHAAVYNLCARILGDREEAQDVTQDVFVKAFSRPPAEADDVRLRPWLYRVATNACLNLLRSRRPGGPVEVEALPASGDPYEQAQTASLIESSLAGMTDRYRAALVLKDLHGLGGRELAEVLEVSRPAADVLVHRARASFRRVFAGLAGSDTVAPANLAVALPVLAAPAALQALPPLAGHGSGPLAASGTHPGIAPLTAAPGAGAAAATGAAPAAGLTAKIAAVLSTKAAVIVVGAAVVAGGGIAAVELAGNGAAPAPGGSAASAALHYDAAGGQGELDGGGWAQHRRAVADHLAGSHDADESVHHAGGDHHGDHESGGSGTHHAADSGHTTATHDSATHEETGASGASSRTDSGTASSTHDGGEAGHDAGGDD